MAGEGRADRAPSEQAIYTHGYSDMIVGVMAARTAERNAAFFLPHLRPGMRALDIGCGPGSITVGLAAAVAPGEVIGIDVEPGQVARARAMAQQRSVENVRFEVASGDHLPFPNGYFDAAFEHTVLEHVANPLAVVREMRRVLKPGGGIGLADGDWGTHALAPALPLVVAGFDLYEQLWRSNGGDPSVGRRQRALLREAGFPRATVRGAAEVRASEEATRIWGEGIAFLLEEARSVGRIAALGLADCAAVSQYAAALRDWSRHPDALWAAIRFEAVAHAA